MASFQLAAMTLVIGGTIGPLSWLVRPGAVRTLRQPPAVWVLGIGSLFGYHVLYFAALRLTPPAEVSSVNYFWPLLIVQFSAFLPGERLHAATVVGAVLGFFGLLILFVGRTVHGVTATHLLGYQCVGIGGFVWAGYSILSHRLNTVPTDTVAVFCLATTAPSLLCHLGFEATVWPDTTGQWLAIITLGNGPAGVASHPWNFGVERGDIHLLELILAGYSKPTLALALACPPIVAGGMA